MSMTGQQIYENFSTAPGPGGLSSAQVELARIKEEYTALSDRIIKVASSFEEGWEGDASGAAQRGAGPLAVEHARASQEMNTAEELLGRQIDSFDLAKNNVTPVPPAPDSPSTMENIFTLGSAQNRYESQVAAQHEAERQNVDTMNLWTNHSSYNERMMPADYGSTLAPPPSITMDSGGTGSSVGDVGRGGPDVNGPAGDSGGTRASGHVPSGSSAFSPPPGTGPGMASVPAASTPGGNLPGSTNPSGYVPPGTGGPGGSTGTGDGTGGSRGGRHRSVGGADGIVPIGGSQGTGNGPGGGRGASGGSPSGGAGSGRAGARLYGGGIGSGAGSATGGPGGGAGHNLGAGRGTGAALPGTSGPSAAGTAGSTGSASGRGTSGMPMGAGAGRGKGGDDDEDHQRKYVLDEDEHFQLTEPGEKLTDPNTGLTTTPPVLGEQRK